MKDPESDPTRFVETDPDAIEEITWEDLDHLDEINEADFEDDTDED